MRRQRYLFLIIILIVILGIFLALSIVNSRNTMMDLIKEEGRSFLLMIAFIQENSIFAEGTYEDAIVNHLIHICEHLENTGTSTNNLRIARESFDIESIVVTDANTGRNVAASGTPLASAEYQLPGNERIYFDYFTVGSIRYMFFKIRIQNHVYSIEISAERIQDFRQEFGLNKIVNQIGVNPLVAYLVLQDRKGIIFATPNISTISRIDDDQSLIDAIDQGIETSRIVDFENESVVELVQPFVVEGQVIGVFRMGMNLSGYHRHVRSTERQLVIIFLIILVGGFCLFFLFMKYESYVGLKELFDRTLSAIEDAVLKVEKNGVIGGVNKMFCNLTSYDEQLLLGSNYYDLFEKDPFDIRKVMTERTKIVNERSLYERSIQYASYPLLDKKNNISGVIVVLRDVTAIRDFEKEREESERLKFLGNLVANFAHEIKNPLNGLSIAAQRLIREFPSGDSEYTHLTTSIRKEIESLNRILNDFLLIAKPRITQREAFDLSSILDNTLDVVNEQLKQHAVVLKKDIKQGIIINGNKDDLKRAILNLLLNAIDAVQDIGRKQREISVVLREEDRGCVLSISDNGKGMDEEESSRIFTPYYTTKKKGTGLGLYIAQKIIREHQGSIEVNTAKGQGTTFTIAFKKMRTRTDRSMRHQGDASE